MKRTVYLGLCILQVVLVSMVALADKSASADQPAVHSSKTPYADRAQWPATSPGQVTLQGFRPFRAVYDRQYTQAGGKGAGEKRQDRVIVSAEEVGWDGRRAVSISVIDSADAKYADTNMRALLMVAAKDDLSALFEIGPAPGKAKDYYISQVMDGQMLVSMVETQAQKMTPIKRPADKPGFGPGSWVMASMKLREGMKINLAPYYSPTANPISQTSYGMVKEKKTIKDGSGKSYDAWVIETPGWYGPTSPKVLQLYVRSTPPYFLGTEIYNYETSERKRFVWLRDLDVLKP